MPDITPHSINSPIDCLDYYDIAIVGAGLVGQVLALGLNQLGYQVALIEAKDLSLALSTPAQSIPSIPSIPSRQDTRAIALSYGSVEILKSWSLWEKIKPFATRINSVHISECGNFSQCRMEAEKLNLEYLGQVIPINYLLEVLMQKINQEADQAGAGIKIFSPAELSALDINSNILSLNLNKKIQAKFIISAEGSESWLRKYLGIKSKVRDFSQVALVGNITLRDFHEYKAYERFTATGPLALLPIGNNKATFIWTLNPSEAERVFNLSDQDFLNSLQIAFGYRAGKFDQVFKRQKYPLVQMIAEEVWHQNILLMGNAAHALHPIAGQGFNLSLRDIAELLKQIQMRGLNHLALEAYLLSRDKDQKELAQFSSFLADVFTQSGSLPKLLRNLGLHVLERQSTLKKYLAERLAGVL